MQSPKEESKKLQEFIEGRVAVTQEELQNLLHVFPDPSNSNVKCEFYMMRCTAEEIREDDFIQFLLPKIIWYVLKRRDYLPKDATNKELIDKSWELVSTARKKFLTKSNKTGEFGELILFVLLESNGIVQVLNKMNLKTDKNMPIHGLDAIHLEVNEGKIILHYGEAKTYKSFTSAIDKAVKGLDEFHNEKDQKRLELNLVSSYIDESKFENYTDLIKNLLLPYSRHKENFGSCNSVFIGYDWDELKNPKVGKDNLTDYLMTRYKESHQDLSEKVKAKIKETKRIAGQKFHVYMLPFRDVGEARRKFLGEVKND